MSTAAASNNSEVPTPVRKAKELIDRFVTGPMSVEAVNAASVAFKKALIERALGAALGHHLGYDMRKIIKTRGHFPSDDAVSKLIWLALRNITADWGRAAEDRKEAMNKFTILYEDRFTKAAA